MNDDEDYTPWELLGQQWYNWRQNAKAWWWKVKRWVYFKLHPIEVQNHEWPLNLINDRPSKDLGAAIDYWAQVLHREYVMALFFQSYHSQMPCRIHAAAPPAPRYEFLYYGHGLESVCQAFKRQVDDALGLFPGTDPNAVSGRNDLCGAEEAL